MCVCTYVFHVSVCAHALCVAVCMCMHSVHDVCLCVYAVCTCLPSASVSRPLFSLQLAVECSGLLRTLHGLEQEHLRGSLSLQQEEGFAKARRQLAIFQRSELHSIFFTQIKSAIFKGELKPEAAKVLLQDYSKIQVMIQIALKGE